MSPSSESPFCIKEAPGTGGLGVFATQDIAAGKLFCISDTSIKAFAMKSCWFNVAMGITFRTEQSDDFVITNSIRVAGTGISAAGNRFNFVVDYLCVMVMMSDLSQTWQASASVAS